MVGDLVLIVQQGTIEIGTTTLNMRTSECAGWTVSLPKVTAIKNAFFIQLLVLFEEFQGLIQCRYPELITLVEQFMACAGDRPGLSPVQGWPANRI